MTETSKWDILKDNVKVLSAAKIDYILEGSHFELEAFSRRIRRLAKHPLTLAVMGEFSAGKSSFLNRLIGQDLLPVSILPKTATLTRLVWGEEAHVEIDYLFNGEVITKKETLDGFGALQCAAKVHDPVVQQELLQIQEVRVFANHHLLRRLHFIDTPGFNHDQSMDDKSFAVVEKADILVWLSDFNQVAKQTEWDQLQRLKARGKHIWLIVNKGDVQISDSRSHAEAVQTLGAHLQETSFIGFFQTNEIFLISCKSSDGLWDGLFQQVVARLSERVLNTDMELSVSLIDDEWQRLGIALQEENVRYQELQSRHQNLAASMEVESLVRTKKQELEDALRIRVRELLDAIQARSQDKKELYSHGIESVNTFSMEYTRGSIDDCLTALKEAYATFLTDIQREHLVMLIKQLERIRGLIPEEHRAFREDIRTIVNHLKLNLSYDKATERKARQRQLPAVACVVGILDHLGIQFNAISWNFSAQISDMGILSIHENGELLTLESYRILQIDAALLRDFDHDIRCFICDTALNQVLHDIGGFYAAGEHRLRRACDAWGGRGE